jgi:hypothetical protein
VGLPALERAAVMPAWAPNRERSSGAAGSAPRRSTLNTPVSAPSKPPVKPIAPRPKRGRFAWKATVGPRSRRRPIAQCLNGGLGWLEVECNRCKTRASLPLDAIRRPRDTPIWKLEAALKCRSCKKGRYGPPPRRTRSRLMFGCIWTRNGKLRASFRYRPGTNSTSGSLVLVSEGGEGKHGSESQFHSGRQV